METILFKVEDDSQGDLLKRAAALLQSGCLVAFPTETVYGLGANALDAEAVLGIFQAKGRPADNPLIVHIVEMEELVGLTDGIPEVAKQLMTHFWPGALTLVFRRSAAVPDGVTGGLDTVAVRMPVHPVARKLLKLAAVPVAAPSANRSGRPSPTTAQHVLEDMDGRIPMIVDGGPCEVGVESTVLDVTVQPPMLLRPGGITREMIEAVIGPITLDSHLAGGTDKPKSPGMKYTHYAPRAPMTLFIGDTVAVEKRMFSDAATLSAEGHRVGVLCTEESLVRYRLAFSPAEAGPGISDGPSPLLADESIGGRVFPLSTGFRGNPASVAAGVFSVLRRFDAIGVDIILAEGFPEAGVGHAIMNRLRKAAGGHVVLCPQEKEIT